MNATALRSRFSLLTLVAFFSAFAFAHAAPNTTAEATQKRADAKAARLVGSLKPANATQAAPAQAVVAEWFVTLWNWHEQHDPRLKDLWSQWAKARAVVPKDEFPGEVIAHQIDAVYASLQPAYRTFLEKLSAHLTPEQIDALKETWSRSPGMRRTYRAYLEIAPDLTDEHKRVILDRMLRAREDAMLTDADKEIVSIYKRHKVKVEAYLGSLEWAKLHKAYANRGRPAASK